MVTPCIQGLTWVSGSTPSVFDKIVGKAGIPMHACTNPAINMCDFRICEAMQQGWMKIGRVLDA